MKTKLTLSAIAILVLPTLAVLMLSTGCVNINVNVQSPKTPASATSLNSTNPPVSGNTIVYTPGVSPAPSECVGPYRLYAKFKNGTSSWFTAPSGAASCTITDVSTYAKPPYYPRVEAVEATTLANWCGSNTVTFPVVGGRKYQFTTYVINTTGLPNAGDPVTLTYVWH